MLSLDTKFILLGFVTIHIYELCFWGYNNVFDIPKQFYDFWIRFWFIIVFSMYLSLIVWDLNCYWKQKLEEGE